MAAYSIRAFFQSVFSLKFLWRGGLALPFVFALLLLTGWIPTVRFAHEQIDIDVYAEHVVVKGLYFYRNPFPFPVRQGLSIPLPTDATHPPPVQISVEQISPQRQAIPVRFLFGRHRFDLLVPARQEVCIQVEYYQRAPEKNARYILTTTQPWRRPLEHGLYRLFPHEVEITSSNYQLSHPEPGVPGFVRKDFMPPHDWTFAWKVK